ncbi:MAG: hypothetical protein JWN14_3715 [Chthonomonadales bacterium]|nr:hypothetical protein [Chthonomonadales bacterium]
MALETVEERMGTLEARMDALQRTMEEQLQQNPTRSKRGWQVIVGSFTEDPLYEEAMRKGRAWREAQHDDSDGTVR